MYNFVVTKLVTENAIEERMFGFLIYPLPLIIPFAYSSTFSKFFSILAMFLSSFNTSKKLFGIIKPFAPIIL